MNRKVTVAAIQMYIEPNDIDANLKKAELLLKRLMINTSTLPFLPIIKGKLFSNIKKIIFGFQKDGILLLGTI
jgi:hypothetical protein